MSIDLDAEARRLTQDPAQALADTDAFERDIRSIFQRIREEDFTAGYRAGWDAACGDIKRRIDVERAETVALLEKLENGAVVSNAELLRLIGGK